MLLRRALPATHQSLAHLFPIYEMGSRKGSAGPSLNPGEKAGGVASKFCGKRNAESRAVLGTMFSSFD